MKRSSFFQPRPRPSDKDEKVTDDFEIDETTRREYDADLDHADDWMIPKDECEVRF